MTGAPAEEKTDAAKGAGKDAGKSAANDATRADAAAGSEGPDFRSSRPVTLVHRIEYGALRFLFWFFRLVGVDLASAISGKFCRAVGPRLHRISGRGRTGLRLAFPDWSDSEIDATLKDVWENLGRTAAEFAHLKAFQPVQSSGRLVIENGAVISTVVRTGRPAIFVSGHFANWELMTIVLKDYGVDNGLVYRTANNPLIDRFIVAERAKVMTQRQFPKGRRGWRSVVACLRDGRSLGMLVDQKLNDGVEASFFDIPAMTTPAPARLALKFDAPIIPARIVRTKGAHFKMTVKEPIDFKPSGDLEADVLALTQMINATLEDDIRHAPGQWLWLHRRWPKTLYRG